VRLDANAVVQQSADGGGCGSLVLTVLNGLTLNGTLTLERTDHYKGSARLSFAGSQTLGGNGTVVFADPGWAYHNWCNPPNAPYVQASSGTLTIGAGVTIRGQRGYVGDAGLPLINQGTISSDGGQTITVRGNSVTNLGTIFAGGGSGVSLGGSWDNSGMLVTTNGTLSLGGSWTNGGAICVTNGTVNLGGVASGAVGVLNVSGATLTPAVAG
jgi:hypothetical protein